MIAHRRNVRRKLREYGIIVGSSTMSIHPDARERNRKVIIFLLGFWIEFRCCLFFEDVNFEFLKVVEMEKEKRKKVQRDNYLGYEERRDNKRRQSSRRGSNGSRVSNRPASHRPAGSGRPESHRPSSGRPKPQRPVSGKPKPKSSVRQQRDRNHSFEYADPSIGNFAMIDAKIIEEFKRPVSKYGRDDKSSRPPSNYRLPPIVKQDKN